MNYMETSKITTTRTFQNTKSDYLYYRSSIEYFLKDSGDSNIDQYMKRNRVGKIVYFVRRVKSQVFIYVIYGIIITHTCKQKGQDYLPMIPESTKRTWR